MVNKIQKLSTATQRVIQLAACIGNQFTLGILSIASEQSLTETARELWEALQVGLILPLDHTYRVPQVLDQQELEKLGKTAGKIGYKFLHDRVQQAAYVMIPDAQKQPVHLKLSYSASKTHIVWYNMTIFRKSQCLLKTSSVPRQRKLCNKH